MRKFLLTSSAFAALIVAGSAGAADLPVKSTPLPAASASPFSWTGLYLGGSVGVAMHHNRYVDLDDWYNCIGCKYSSNSVGALFGAQAGYNWQVSNWVIGIETDIHHGTGKATAVVNGCDSECTSVETKTRWMGSVRGRLGFAVDRALFYATGGFAYGNPNSVWFEESNSNEFNRTKWRTGYVVGFGAEYAFTNHWTARVEGLYYNLGTETIRGVSERDYRMDVKNEQLAARFGINYKFGGGQRY
jgi:outer membrane immunogenic protein